jgi:ketosteroid isomerase-like protein
MGVGENKARVEAMWADLGRRDFDAVKQHFTTDAHYTDVPAPEEGAFGRDEIAARLRLGLEPLAGYEPHAGTTVAEGDMVIVEHSEEWRWHTGESLVLPFVSVFELRDGLIARWWDYWDLGTLMNAAPAWWIEQISGGYK